jgi:hypothetical protein
MHYFKRFAISGRSHTGGVSYCRRNLRQFIVFIAGAALLSGCATTQHVASVTALKSTSGPLKIALMPLDVQLSVLTAGGVLEPHSAWTEAAKNNINAAMDGVEKDRQVEFLSCEQPAESDPEADRLNELETLNGAVGQAILFQKLQLVLYQGTRMVYFDKELANVQSLIASASIK